MAANPGTVERVHDQGGISLKERDELGLVLAKSIPDLPVRSRLAILRKMRLDRARMLKDQPLTPAEVYDLWPFSRAPNFGPKSQKAIEVWLRSKGFPMNGEKLND